MKAKSLLSAGLAAWLGLAVFGGAELVAEGVAEGAPKPAPKAAKVKPEEPAPTVGKPVSIAPKELAWGIGHKKLEAIYDKVVDDDYKERYRKVQPGPEMEALDAEVAEKKDVFRRSRIDFGNLPTGIDGTPLKPEYTYNNKEALMQISRAGKTRHFFFIQDRLWKIIDELPVNERAAWGKDFTEAAVKLSKAYRIPGRVREADPAANRPVTEIDWKDSQTEVRAVDWGNGKFGLVFQDSGTVAQLGSLRSAKATQTNGVDATVQDVLREPSQPPELPKDKGKDKGKDKKSPGAKPGDPPPKK